jgi:hypothetical protein
MYGSALAVPPGGHVVEGLARAQQEARDTLIVGTADQQLCSAPVVHREGHLTQLKALDELTHDLSDTPHREVGVRAHGVAMRAQRQGRQHAAIVRAQVLDDVAPQRAIHDEPVQQHDHRSAAAGVLVLDRARRQLYFAHRPPPLTRHV